MRTGFDKHGQDAEMPQAKAFILCLKALREICHLSV